MLIKHAKEIARQWASEEAERLPGLRGAFSHGSVNWQPDDYDLPDGSDLDIILLLEEPDPQRPHGKFLYQGVILDVSSLPVRQFQSAEQVLSVSHLAGSFQSARILLDPSGTLANLQATVTKDFAKRIWVQRRCEHARDKVLNHLRQLTEGKPLPDQVLAWLFGTGVTTHILLVAGLRNPTVRKRYAAVRDLLADYGRSDFYPALLELLGCTRMSRERVEHHLLHLAEVFDATREVMRTPSDEAKRLAFASDISDLARPLAIDGSQELIERDLHREAVFWIAVTYSRCLTALSLAVPTALQETYLRGYHELLGDLGIRAFADLENRSRQVRGFLPRVWEVAEEIMDKTALT